MKLAKSKFTICSSSCRKLQSLIPQSYFQHKQTALTSYCSIDHDEKVRVHTRHQLNIQAFDFWSFSNCKSRDYVQHVLRISSRSTVVLTLVRNGTGSKWSPVHKVQKQLPEKQSRRVQKAYRQHPLATLMLNLLYKIH